MDSDDPLPFHFLHQQPELCARTTFVDVDYPQLMHKKRACISNSAALHELLPFLTSGVSDGPDVWRAGQYLAVGCDLRKLSELEDILKKEVHVHDCAILFVAEVSVAYMDVKSADAVVSWASTFKDAQFCILEQCLPEGPSHPFASTMLSHFEKLHTHLKVVYQYPTLKDQETRFRNAGWTSATARTLWELWGDDEFLPPDQRRRLDAIEPFDEWEEFALFGGHYLLLVAATSASTREADNSQVQIQQANAKLDMQPVPRDGSESSLRRFGAAYSHRSKVIYHGGYGEKTRLSDCDIYTADATYEGKFELQPGKSGPIMCQTITNAASGDDLFLLAGGRESPSKAVASTWLVTSTGRSISAESFNTDRVFNGRYRHCAVPVLIDNRSDAPGVLIYGGKSDANTVLGDFLLFDLKKQSWSFVPSAESDQGCGLPPARFGASMCHSEQSASIGAQSGILMGGISADGTILSDVWEWTLSWQDGIPAIKCTERTGEMGLNNRSIPFARFGAAIVPLSNHFLLIGGVTNDRITSWNEEILLISLGPERWIRPVQMPACPSPRPLFVGIGATKADDKIVLVGGGAVCFSMGSFWNTKSYSLRLDYEQEMSSASPEESCGKETTGMQTNGSQSIVEGSKPEIVSSAPAIKQIGHTTVRTKEEFDAIVAAGQPVILTDLDIGPCVDLWTPEYLLSHIGADRPVIVHSCPTSRMTFQTKNFSYLKQNFGDFIKDVTAGGQLYLRSVASTQPAKHPTQLSKDFPSLAADFRLPDALSAVAEGAHSSPLRISGPVTLWLHYDVLANVLCQIRGAKRLRLYPPGDVALLAYPPGASSSNIDVYAPADELSPAQRAALARAHPHEAFLRPGDVLFIPPAWSHTARPDEEVSVAVNVFWRNLEKEVYAAGRDVYGNRDIAAYEEGRKAVEKIVKGFEGVPRDLRMFYLERLVGELRDGAEGAAEVERK